MPRYFFNVAGTRVSRDLDPEGVELASLDHARYEAIAFAADTMKNDYLALWDGGDVRIEVTDNAQVVILTVVISVVLHASGPSSSGPG